MGVRQREGRKGSPDDSAAPFAWAEHLNEDRCCLNVATAIC